THEALGGVRRPEAHQDDEDEGGDQVEGKPEEPRRRPGEGDPPAASLPPPTPLLAERALVFVLELCLVLLDVLEVETRCRLRRGEAGHPPPSRRCGWSPPRDHGAAGTGHPGPSRASAHRLQ